jgi:CRP-like cAMP-binding protein
LFLKAHPFLGSLPPHSIASLAAHTEERFFAAGETVYEEGVAPELVYFLASGSIRVEYAGAKPFDAYAPGGVGLIELFADSPRPPGAHALEETLTLAVDANSALQLLEDDFVFYATIAAGCGDATLDALTARGDDRPAEHGFPEHRAQETYAVLDLVHRLAQAREAPLFEGSNLTVLTELLRFQKPRTLGAGTVLWQEGSAVDSMALILDGSFVSAAGEGETHHPAGSVLGAWEIFSDEPRRETARSVTPARIIEIDRTLFVDVLEDHFGFALDYLGKLCRRFLEVRSRPLEGTGARENG